jgi:hypothetical protein
MRVRSGAFGASNLPSPGGLAVIAALAVGQVIAVRAHSNVSGTGPTIAALALAPVSALAATALGARIGRRTALGAAAVCLVLPFAGRQAFYGSFLQVYDHDVMPALVGLRHTGWFALGIVAALAIAFVPERIAGIAGIVAAAAAAVAWIDVSWTHLYGDFHETTWSPTLLCYLPFAGVLGLATRRPWLAAAIGGWFAVLLLRGVNRPYYSGGLWLSLAAAVPAMALLLTSLALLVPPLPPLRRLRKLELR